MGNVMRERVAALAAERAAIAAESPRHNVRHVMRREPRQCMPSTKPTVSVRLPDDLLEFVDRIAAQLDRSRNWVIVDLVRKAKDDQR